MATVSDALSALGVTQWVLRGDPTNADEFASMFGKITGTDENGSAIESDNSADFGTDWDAVFTKQSELTAAEPLKALRAERDRLIAATDWWASSDLTMTSAQTDYRQALRDITDDANSLDDVTWPTAP
tara:strand:- start:74 stop:457 length:384 start_codon:yes stop_codon:yes gene_type:complete